MSIRKLKKEKKKEAMFTFIAMLFAIKEMYQEDELKINSIQWFNIFLFFWLLFILEFL